MKKPLVSVIVSCYKCGDRLATCIDSLLNQTLCNIEIICIDDKSPDSSKEIINNYSSRDDRIIAVFNDKNIGVSASRNKGIGIAKGKYVMFCDADDYYSPTACEEMLSAIEKNNADLAINEINVIYESHKELEYSDSKYYSLKYSGLKLINDEVILNIDYSPTNKIFRKEVLDRNNIRFPEGLYYEDAYFCIAYLCSSKTIFFLNKRLYNYIRHKDSIMSTTFSKKEAKDYSIDHIYIISKVYDYLKERRVLDKYNSLFWRLFFLYELAAINNSKTKNSKKLAKNTAENFINKNKESFNKAEPFVKKSITKLNSSILRINKNKIKDVLIRAMPAYRLQEANIQRLRKILNS